MIIVFWYILGAILVFLPGYDEIVSLRDLIQDDKRFLDGNRYVLTPGDRLKNIGMC